ncbi:MAG: CRTAC1 family protein [Planctomycetota bacterium]|nr:MAG: CRTAC1 family protein [Planctomycetota bacterium]
MNRCRWGMAIILLLLAGSPGCTRPPAAVPLPPARDADRGGATANEPRAGGGIDFVERAAELGIAATYRNGGESDHCTILESLGGGVGWFDFDRDGWLDLVATGGGGITAEETIHGRPCTLFRSENGKTFHPAAAEAGIASATLYSHGVAVGDHDNDGFQDLLVTGYGVPQFWRNMGDGTFVVAPSPAGEDARWSSSAGWADLNGDGVLDLYLARYVNWSFDNHPRCGPSATVRDICPPRSFEGLPDMVCLGNGDGTFTDASAAAGLRSDGKGLGVLLADLDVDGDVDVYVANDTTDNFLYVNDGHGHLAENGLVSGTALDDQGVPNGSMGIDLCDFNRDGLPDVWVTNFEREWFALYRNEGRGYFLHVSRRYGITDIGGLFVGFGTACDDFDADGWVDIVVSDGHVIKYPDASPLLQEPLFLRFDGDRFRRGQPQPGSYFAKPHMGRGLASGDYDGDGDLDLAISHVEAPVAVLENRFPQAGRSILVQLVGTVSNRDAVGARLEVIGGEGPSPALQVTGGGSYLSHSDRRLHVVRSGPAGAAALVPQRLRVRWPSGVVQEVELTGAEREIRVVEAGAVPAEAAGTPAGGAT